MQIILLEKISKLGNIGDQVNVKAGYARNFLIPKKMAVSATKANIAYFNSKRSAFEADFQKKVAAAEAKAEQIHTLGAIVIKVKSGEQGRLFGSVGSRDIIEVLKEHNIELEKGEVKIPQETIRVLGTYEVNINLHANIHTTINVEVIAE